MIQAEVYGCIFVLNNVERVSDIRLATSELLIVELKLMPPYPNREKSGFEQLFHPNPCKPD
jgi:hypothetical protein